MQPIEMTHRRRGVPQKSISDNCFSVFIYFMVIFFMLFCLIPFWMVFINSFAAESNILKYGYQLIPLKYSLSAYQTLFSGGQIYRSYAVTIFVTVVGTVLAVGITAMYAYVLAHPKVKYGKILSFLTYFTMIFGGGLVGFYILITRWLGLKDSIWALILPYLLNPFYAFVLVSFFRTIPYEINEAATIDGANEVNIFFKIICPISLPALATVTLFYALQYWNDWWLALLFIDDYKLHPLQIMIRQLISNINAASYVSGSSMSYTTAVPSNGMQLAIVCLTIGPIIFLYPLIQKYFIKGITLGSIKG